jgi:hypothetical protein
MEMAKTYTMRGQVYEFARPTNAEEMNRLNWLVLYSNNPEYRKLAAYYVKQGVEVKDVETRTQEVMNPVYFSEISLIARQTLRRRGASIDGTTVTFPEGTKQVQVQSRAHDVTLMTYVLPDSKELESYDGSLNVKK